MSFVRISVALYPYFHTKSVSQVEVCPEALSVCTRIAERVTETKGAALLIDYGEDGVIQDSFTVR